MNLKEPYSAGVYLILPWQRMITFDKTARYLEFTDLTVFTTDQASIIMDAAVVYRIRYTNSRLFRARVVYAARALFISECDVLCSSFALCAGLCAPHLSKLSGKTRLKLFLGPLRSNPFG